MHKFFELEIIKQDVKFLTHSKLPWKKKLLIEYNWWICVNSFYRGNIIFFPKLTFPFKLTR